MISISGVWNRQSSAATPSRPSALTLARGLHNNDARCEAGVSALRSAP